MKISHGVYGLDSFNSTMMTPGSRGIALGTDKKVRTYRLAPAAKHEVQRNEKRHERG